ICANFEKKNKVQDQTAQALLSRIFTLKNHDLYSKIDKYINENVKEVIQNALKAPVHERFRELSEFEMKEILRDRMDELVKETAKSRKRRHDNQDPHLPPSKDLDQNKKKRHNSDTSALKQSQAQTSSAWKTSDTRETPSSSSKQKIGPQSE
ncbi:hypothetical protein Tco_0279671, partial [Tanacetum coccineum]